MSAAWTLSRAGFEDFVVFDLEDARGGTARGGEQRSSPYPMGAHYLPEPPANCPELIELLEGLDLIVGRDAGGSPEYLPSAICAAPTERHYHGGLWHAGLYPAAGQSESEAQEWVRWNAHLEELAAFRDAKGRPGFRLPIHASSPHFRHLDRQTITQYLDEQGFRSWRIRWFVDYACRDDYGTPAEHTSAFAALHHFLCREFGDDRSGFLLTAPQGNMRLLDTMADKIELGDRQRLGHLVRAIDPERGLLTVERMKDGALLAFECEHILWAAPRFVLSRILARDPARDAVAGLSYAPWLVANLQLDRAPRGGGARLAWDNVPVDDVDLGYVVANHSDGLDRRGPNAAREAQRPHVITYYRSLGTDRASLAPARSRLLASGPELWREEVFKALERMHSGIRKWCSSIHLHRWGHAMVRPEAGLLFGEELESLARPIGRVRPCATDLSGIALFEEAFYRGRRAAREALAELSGGQSGTEP
jgi:hypothetical protein